MLRSRSDKGLSLFLKRHWLKMAVVFAIIFLWKSIKGIFSDLGKPFRDLFNSIGDFWERLVNQPAGGILTNDSSSNYVASVEIINSGMNWFSSDYWREISKNYNSLAVGAMIAGIESRIPVFISDTVDLVDRARALHNQGNFQDSKALVILIKKKFKDFFISKFVTSYCFDQFEKSINGGFQRYLRMVFALGDGGNDSLYLELVQHLKSLTREI